MKSMTSAAASTGVASSWSRAVTSIVQQKIGMRNIVIPGARMRNIVTRKLAAPIVEDMPSTTTARIHMSMPTPVCWASGLYAVHPLSAAPPSTMKPANMRMPAGGSIQKESALIRGKAMSAAPIWSGTR